MAKRGLGRGLEALIPDSAKDDDIREVDIYSIDPRKDQPRKKFDEDSLKELAQSIKNHGLVQPIILKPHGNRYVIIAGERRWRASKAAGIKKVPAIIKRMDEQQTLEVSLIENLQRQDLNPIEQAEAINVLIKKHSMTQEQVAKTLGKSRPSIANILRLLSLDDVVKKYLQEEKITYGHARALLAISNKEIQREIAQRITKENLTVRDVEKLIRDMNKRESEKKSKPARQKDVHIVGIEEEFGNLFGTKVNIVKGKKKGKIEIEFYNNDDFERIYEILNNIK
ncbi:MAG: ParB/RepB/Spo0J family partition protein [Clostridia bacterium]|nr:ParB/RepB/Spo0J family partition protein [Clostridia bacterium]